MYQALIESGLGSEYSANTGYDGSTMVTSLSIGVQGMKQEDASKVEKTITDILQKVKEDGVDPKRIEAIVHQMELGQKHVRSLADRDGIERYDSQHSLIASLSCFPLTLAENIFLRNEPYARIVTWMVQWLQPSGSFGAL